MKRLSHPLLPLSQPLSRGTSYRHLLKSHVIHWHSEGFFKPFHGLYRNSEASFDNLTASLQALSRLLNVTSWSLLDHSRLLRALCRSLSRSHGLLYKLTASKGTLTASFSTLTTLLALPRPLLAHFGLYWHSYGLFWHYHGLYYTHIDWHSISLYTTVLGSIPASSDTAKSGRRQMKQCWVKYTKIQAKMVVNQEENSEFS